jgi:hypothetical protein
MKGVIPLWAVAFGSADAIWCFASCLDGTEATEGVGVPLSGKCCLGCLGMATNERRNVTSPRALGARTFGNAAQSTTLDR